MHVTLEEFPWKISEIAIPVHFLFKDNELGDDSFLFFVGYLPVCAVGRQFYSIRISF